MCQHPTTFATFSASTDPAETCRWFMWATNGGYPAFHSRSGHSGIDNIADVQTSRYAMQMRQRCHTPFVLCLLLLAGCYQDITIYGDYKLYDLNGSNQAIIGHEGMVSASNVTGYATEGALIFVEIGREGEGFENPGPTCSYQVIDASRNIVSKPLPGSRLFDLAAHAVRTQQKGLVSRSCVNGNTAAAISQAVPKS